MGTAIFGTSRRKLYGLRSSHGQNKIANLKQLSVEETVKPLVSAVGSIAWKTKGDISNYYLLNSTLKLPRISELLRGPLSFVANDEFGWEILL